MRSTHGFRCLYTVVGFAGDRWISRYDSHLTIVPGDRDRIPTRLSDLSLWDTELNSAEMPSLSEQHPGLTSSDPPASTGSRPSQDAQ